LIRRTLAAAFLVDHAYRVLLLHLHDPDRPDLGTWWALPSDAVRRREPPPDAARRALREETGLDAGVRVGPCVWVRGRERTYVAWLDDPTAPRSELAGESPARLGERWWTLDELAASGETFRPPRLPALAPAVVRGEYGPAPVDAT
jgi:ADP-ribose pyrophosphatase YjhB (NUDIX family)